MMYVAMLQFSYMSTQAEQVEDIGMLDADTSWSNFWLVADFRNDVCEAIILSKYLLRICLLNLYIRYIHMYMRIYIFTYIFTYIFENGKTT